MALQRVRSNMLANNFTLDDDQGLIVGSGNNIYIDTVNNRVGINTNSPTHDFTVSGNIYASGNITAGGDIQLGDSDTDTITISAEIGSNILPDITNTYDLGSASKVWAEVHATTFRGDGSQLTGLTSTLNDVLVNGNTTALNIVSTGDITATNFIGDGSQLTGLASTLNDILGNGNTTALNIVSTGDITAANFIGDGSQLTGLASTLDEVTTNGATTTNSITVGDLIVNSTNAIGLPVGTTAQRPTAANGLMRFNSTLLEFEGYNGTEWGALGGGGATYSTSAPTVNLSEGDLWFDTGTTGELYVYSGTEWLSVTGAGGTAFYQRSFTGDNTTTVFNVYGTGSGTVLVYINGIFVTSPADYSYSAGSVTFVTAPALNDEINVLVYGSTTGISLDINSLTDVSAASPSTGQVLKWTGTSWTPQADNSPTGDANRIVYDLADPSNSVVLTSGDAVTPAQFTGNIKGDVLKLDGTVIVDVSSTTATFSGGLAGAVYGDVYNPTGTVKILESGSGSNDSQLDIDTLNATTTNISGIATFTGSSVDFTGTTTMGSWNGPVYDRTGGTLIIEDNASPNPIVHADLDGDVTGTVSSIANHTTSDLTEGTNLYYTDTKVGTYISGDRTYGNITTTGYVAGPAVFTIDPAGVGDNTGTVVIAGNLQVDGTTTTINSTTVTVDDLNLTLASGAINAAAANGAGITVDGAGAALTYNGTSDLWKFTKQLQIDPGYLTLGDTGGTDNSWINNLEDGNVEIVNQGRQSDAGGIRINRFNSPGGDTTYFRDFDVYDGKNSLVLKVDGSEGKVGIGTTAPDALLHVSDTSPHIDIGPQGGNRGKIGYHDLDVIIGSTSGTGEIIFKNNIGSTDSPQTSGDTKMVIHDVGMTLYSDTYNILNVATDTNDDQTSTDGIIKITTGSSYTTKAELRWDESEDLVHVSYGDHGRHISIDSSGNVGVGTGSTSPSTTLEVAGTTKAEQYLLEAIAKDISDTAVDVFVYDTRKDSDGGAWRKRTQHTSWYNETLNTSTRGSRREFPAVAVIVTESNKVTIYDGDDPDMPMWMVFDGGDRADMIYGLFDNSQKATKMLNGLLVSVGNDSGGQGGTFPISFIADNGYFLSDASNSPYKYIGNIEQRNDGLNITAGESGNYGVTVSRYVNDVAMTVLPNAPIDSATGLPVPTIAVATNGGISIIHNDGSVSDITSSYAPTNRSSFVGFNGEEFLADMGTGADRSWMHTWAAIPTVDTVVTVNNRTVSSGIAPTTWYDLSFLYSTDLRYLANSGSEQFTAVEVIKNQGPVLCTNDGMSIIDENLATPANGMIAYTTSTYNTGWMNGDIKLATLSDTDDTDVSATNTEFLTGNDSSFTSGLGSWQGYNATLSRVNNALRVADNGGYSTAYQTITTVVGKQYVFSAIVSNNGDFATISAGSIAPAGNAWGNYGLTRTQSNGTFTFTFTATATTTYLILGSEGSTSTDYDSLSLKEAEEDRSVNGNGLQVFGTVTKNPVATGADLVAYSGFSTSNYLAQPYNSGLDFGTGDFSYMGWVKWVSGTGYLFDRADTSGSRRVALYPNSNGAVTFYTENGYATAAASTLSTNIWSHVTIVRRSGLIYGYHNGVQVIVPFADTGSKTSADGSALFKAGVRFNSVDALDGSIALLRASATAPSAAQIKKIYEDEKHLFQENAKATLYGTSDAVTALAYDDDTELLHVGTSAGRSVFRGLRRVDNTTDAVGATISASNGLVAED